MLAAAPSRAPAHYARRRPEQTVLFDVLQEHLETFLALASEHGDGPGLPRFVVKELREFLSCGILAKGFARFRCDGCGHDRLVAFSCKGRGFCPSCGGKRMTALAAHLVDHVIPRVPTRQYVLSLPHALRPRLAYDHSVQKRVLAIWSRALLHFYEQRAAESFSPRSLRLCEQRAANLLSPRSRGESLAKRGEEGLSATCTGAVTFIQRFGTSLNLHMHFHTVVLDGVFTEDASGALSFRPLPPPTPTELRVLLSVVRHEVLRFAVSEDLLSADTIPDLALDAPALAALVGASSANLRALGPRAGAPVQRVLSGIDPLTLPPRTKARLSAHQDGFDVHAALSIRPRQRKVLAGGPGRLPSRSSHGSGLARFAHPALRVTGSLRSGVRSARFGVAEMGTPPRSSACAPS